jgi:PhnB protein
MGDVKPIPDAYPIVTPYLIIDGASKAIEFYKAAFGAVETVRIVGRDGGVGHAEIRIGGAPIMLANECPGMTARGPHGLGGTPVSLVLYVEDVDAVVEKAVAAGATLARPVADQFYGDRTGTVTDPFGHQWHISTHKEDVPPDELQRRATAAFAG